MTKKLVIQKLQEYKHNVNEERKATARKLYDYYNGDLVPHLHELLQRQFEKDYDMMKLRPRVNNIIDFVIDANSKVFAAKMEYKFKHENTQIIFDEFVKRSFFNQFMDEINKLTNLLNLTLVRPVWRNERMEIDVILPQIFDVIQNKENSTQADAIIIEKNYKDTLGNTQILYYYWDNENHFIFDNEDNIHKVANNDNFINPYGEVPYVEFRKKVKIDTFFGFLPYELENIQDNINILLTDLNNLIKFQAFTPVVIEGWDGKAFIEISPSKPLCLTTNMHGVNPNVKTLDMSGTKIMDLWNHVREQITLTAFKWNIPPSSFKVKSTIMSGFQLRMENVKLIEERARQIKIYEVYVENFFKKFKLIYNYHAKSNLDLIPEDEEITIIFGDIKIEKTVDELNQERDSDLKHGIKSPIDYIMANNPDITEEEAEKKFLKNLEYMSKIKSAEQGFVPQIA